MVIAVTGAEYGIGRNFAHEVMRRGHELIEDDGLDLLDNNAVFRFIRRHHPDAVIHCRDNMDYHVLAAENLAAASNALKIPLMYVSTSDVFGRAEEVRERTQRNPKSETELIRCHCENRIANCKKFYIMRLPKIIFGQGGSNDIILKLLERGRREKEITLNSTAKFSVVYSADAAELGIDIIENGRSGVYHCANEEVCTEYTFACEVYRLTRLAGHDDYYDVAVHPTESGGHPFVMKCESVIRAGIEPLESWESAVRRYIKSLR